MNYCLLKDAWEENNTISNFISNIEDKSNIRENESNNEQTTKLNENFTNVSKTNNVPNSVLETNNLCDCDKITDYIIKCENCHNKLLIILIKNKYNMIINHLINILKINKDFIILILIFLFIILLFNLISKSLKLLF